MNGKPYGEVRDHLALTLKMLERIDKRLTRALYALDILVDAETKRRGSGLNRSRVRRNVFSRGST